MADFGSSFAQGVSQGAAIVRSGQQLSLERMQQRQQELRAKQQDLLRPLQMKALEQQNTLMALKIKQAELEQGYAVSIETAFTEASELLSRSKLSDPAVQSQLFSIFEKVPQALKDPRFKAVMETVDAAQQLDELRNRVRGQTSMPADLAVSQRATDLRMKLQNPNLTPEERQQASIELEELRLATADKGGMTVYDPATGKPIVSTGGAKAMPPAAIQRLNSATDLLRNMDDLDDLMTTETMGVGGKFWDVAGAIFGQSQVTQAMLTTGMKDSVEKRQAFETAANFVKKDIIKALKSDGNINQKELDRLESIPPSDFIFDNPTTGKPRLREIKKKIIEAMRTSYDQPENGGPPRPYRPEMLKPVELIQGFLNGSVNISGEQLARLLNKSPYEEQKQAALELWQKAKRGQP